MPVWPHMMQRTPVGIRFGVLMFLSEMPNLLNIVTIYITIVYQLVSLGKRPKDPQLMYICIHVSCVPIPRFPPQYVSTCKSANCSFWEAKEK